MCSNELCKLTDYLQWNVFIIIIIMSKFGITEEYKSIYKAHRYCKTTQIA